MTATPRFTSVGIDLPINCPRLGSLPSINEQINGHQTPSIMPLSAGVPSPGRVWMQRYWPEEEKKMMLMLFDWIWASPLLCLGFFFFFLLWEVEKSVWEISHSEFPICSVRLMGLAASCFFLFSSKIPGSRMQHGSGPEGGISRQIARFLFTANLTLNVTWWTCCTTARLVLCDCVSVGKLVSTSLWMSWAGFHFSHCRSQHVVYSRSL